MVYDIASGNWTTSPAGLVTPRSDACMAALDSKLYIAGGLSGLHHAQKQLWGMHLMASCALLVGGLVGSVAEK